jgi:hypothetical protein
LVAIGAACTVGSCTVDAAVGRLSEDSDGGDDASTTETGPGTGDAAHDDGPSGDDGSQPTVDAGCGVTFAQEGAWIGIEVITSGSPPEGAGGAVKIGTYKLTALRAYGGSPGTDEERETLVITGSSNLGTIASLDEARNTSGPYQSHAPRGATTSWSADSPTHTVFFNDKCPNMDVGGGQYTATPTTLLIIQTGSPPLDREYTFVR